jgi:signal transduction histidine kinase
MIFSPRIKIFLAIFLPLFLVMSAALAGIYFLHTSQIDSLDEHVFEKALENSWEEFQDPLQNIISQEDWNTLSLAEIDKKLLENGERAIGNPSDPFYFLTPQEIQQQFQEENIPIMLELPQPIPESEISQAVGNLDFQPTSALIDSFPDQNFQVPTATGIYEIQPTLGLQEIREIEEGFSQKIIWIFSGVFLVLTLFVGIIAWIFARKSLQPLEQALEKQKEFVANVSHELRTPLTMMKTEAQVLLESDEKNISQYKKFLMSTVDDVEQLNNLTTNLLSLSHLENLENQNSQTDEISGEWKRLQERFSLRAEQEEKNFSMPNTSQIHIRIPKIGFEACLQILLDNAFKYTEKSDQIEVLYTNKKENFQVEVRDNGEGIDEKFLGKIFERFTKADQSRNTKGFGLGLSLLCESMESIGGKISVESEKGKFSVFTLTFPKYADFSPSSHISLAK